MAQRVTVAEALRAATRTLVASTTPRLDAEVLLAASLAVTRAQLYCTPESTLNASAQRRFERLVSARQAGKPIPYLTGRAEFWSLELAINEDVLVPRPETELVVERVLELWPRGRAGVLLDLGTGSGAIAAALAVERPQAAIMATDISLPALRLAQSNFQRLGLTRVGTCCGDWLAALGPNAYDLIVSNPPYVAASDFDAMDVATAFEPRAALYAGMQGMAALALIIEQAPRHLRVGGSVVLEHGRTQGAAVRGLLSERGYGDVVTRRDLAGHERVSGGTWALDADCGHAPTQPARRP